MERVQAYSLRPAIAFARGEAYRAFLLSGFPFWPFVRIFSSHTDPRSEKIGKVHYGAIIASL